MDYLILWILLFLVAPVFLILGFLPDIKRYKPIASRRYHRTLTERFPFYAGLNEPLQHRFTSRLVHFMRAHTFEGRESFVVTTECKVLISSAAVHLTLGLDDYSFAGIDKVIVYPGIFHSKFTGTYNRGETNPHGIVVFSWPHIVEGFADLKDHMNLAYHEFAHALILQSVNDRMNDEIFNHGYILFSDALKEDHLSQRVRKLNIFRDYAFTNKMEFFAVAVEHFMETPRQLHDECYELYDLLRHMLRQDPLTDEYGTHFPCSYYSSPYE
jgi:MtfA peptidase